MSSVPPELSIVIPSFNEELRLPVTLADISAYIRASKRETEVIVVDDGSTDRTADIASSFRGEIQRLRVIANKKNRGKGYSVRHGMLEARGRIVLFTDADLSAPIDEADKLLAALANHDVAIGSRALDRSLIEVHQSPLRELAGMVFNFLVRAITGLRFVDTQCGFKAFLLEPSRIIFEQQRIERFGFDPEILFLAKRHGLRAVEIPVRWAHDPQTRVNKVRDSLQMFGEVLSIRWNWLLGRYPKRRQ